MNIYYSPLYHQTKQEYDTIHKSKYIARSLKAIPVNGVNLVEPPMIDMSLLCEVHSPEYILALSSGSPVGLVTCQGFEWSPELIESVLYSTSGVVAAVDDALENGVSGSLSSGLHHAKYDHGEGFCTINGLAVAIAHALKNDRIKKILVLDFDAHCGGGTHSLIQRINLRGKQVIHADVSTNFYDEYTPSDFGNGDSTLEIIENGQDYLPRIKSLLADLSKSHDEKPFDLCLYNAGMDVAYVFGGRFSDTCIDEDILMEREHQVFNWCISRNIPVAFVMAGGYKHQVGGMENLVELHRITIETAANILPAYRAVRRSVPARSLEAVPA